MVCEVVTVALTPEDAQKLETSKTKGGITMFLRPFGESATVKTGLITWDNVIQSKKNNGKDEDDEAPQTAKTNTGSVPESLQIPPSTPTTVQFQQPVEKLVQRITNDTIVKHTYTKDADGNYETHSELIRPHVNSSSNTPDARSAQPPSPAAAAPDDKAMIGGV